MKKITIKNLTIVDYQKFRQDNYFEFDEHFNLLSGFNGVGKTTVISAIAWCLTGFDYLDRNKFDIKPKENGEVIENARPFVKINLVVNNEPIEISRTYKENKTAIRVNSIDVGTLKEYENFVKNKFGLSIVELKLLLNPTHIATLNQNELRDLIMKNFSSVDENEIAKAKKYQPIAKNIADFGIVNFTNGIKKELSELKNRLIPNIKGRIEQQQLAIDEIGNINSNIKELKTSKQVYEEKLATYNVKVIENNNRQIKLTEERDKLNKMYNILHDIKRENDMNMNEMQRNKIRIKELCDVGKVLEREKVSCNHKIDELEREINYAKPRLDGYKAKVDELKTEISLYKAKLGSYNGVCEFCGQILPQDVFEREKANFDLKINNKINALTKDLNFYIELVDKTSNTIKNNEQEIEDTKAHYEAFKKANNKNQYLKNPEVAKLMERQEELKEIIEKAKKDIKKATNAYDRQVKVVNSIPKIEELDSPNELMDKLKDINNKLNLANNLVNEKAKLDALAKDYDNACNKLNKCTLIIELCEEFIKDKAEFTKKQLRSYFNDVEFITEELQKNGDTKECFKIGLDGKAYNMLSTGEKVRVGLDLVCGLQKLQDVQLPILIDQLGELSELDNNIEQQIIGCKTMQKLKEKEKEKDEDMYNKYTKAYSKIVLTKGE